MSTTGRRTDTGRHYTAAAAAAIDDDDDCRHHRCHRLHHHGHDHDDDVDDYCYLIQIALGVLLQQVEQCKRSIYSTPTTLRQSTHSVALHQISRLKRHGLHTIISWFCLLVGLPALYIEQHSPHICIPQTKSATNTKTKPNKIIFEK